MLKCVICGEGFERPGKRGPLPKYCSAKCVSASKRTPERQQYEKRYHKEVRRVPSRWARILDRGREYRRRLGDTYRARMRERWHRLHGDPFPEVVLAAPYSGHPWLDRARAAVVRSELDGSTPWADDRYDEMGEALLALLEGRDPEAAVKEFRRKEYIPRNRMLRLSDWKEESVQNEWWEHVMPKEESAEDTFLRSYVDKVRYSGGSNNTALHTKGKKLNQPRKRRQKDAGWRKHL